MNGIHIAQQKWNIVERFLLVQCSNFQSNLKLNNSVEFAFVLTPIITISQGR